MTQIPCTPRLRLPAICCARPEPNRSLTRLEPIEKDQLRNSLSRLRLTHAPTGTPADRANQQHKRHEVTPFRGAVADRARWPTARPNAGVDMKLQAPIHDAESDGAVSGRASR